MPSNEADEVDQRLQMNSDPVLWEIHQQYADRQRATHISDGMLQNGSSLNNSSSNPNVSTASSRSSKQSSSIKQLKEDILKRRLSERKHKSKRNHYHDETGEANNRIKHNISKKLHQNNDTLNNDYENEDYDEDNDDEDIEEEIYDDQLNSSQTTTGKHSGSKFSHGDVDVEMIEANSAKVMNNNLTINHSQPLIQDFFTRRYKPRSSSILRPFSSFIGSQQSGRSTYEVRVDLKEVDLKKSYLCGFLTIHGLTKTHPEITTFFKGEIVGPHYSFYTTNEEWGSNPKNDLQHWGRFPSWRNLEFNVDNDSDNQQIYENHLSNEYLYMRWKEVFLVPDATVKDISGASFAGFYYVCFNQLTGSISGLYFHKCSDKYQQLELAHIPDGGCFSSYEYC